MGPQGWARRWPQCRLLLELALLCVETGGVEACRRLLRRLAATRPRMADAPAVVDSLLAELAYAATLRLGDNLPAARVHAGRAVLKAAEIEKLLPAAKSAEVREWGRRLRRASTDLCLRADSALARSEAALARSQRLRYRQPLAEILAREPRRSAAS